ncbi:FecR domain-containing protein [Brevundimonas sp.]|uniref:FecR domain-containing protein n=1 Tax=Brevundimonas sp. TaxID=1871086 RepID=UPI0025C10C57|nr:FecR domain-containing protein [Brevundimonas sp.]
MFGRILAGLVLGAALLCGHDASAQPDEGRTVAYTVTSGDTLIDLAESWLLRREDYRVVARLNGVTNPRRLAVGRTLRFPVHLLRTRPAVAVVSNVRGEASVRSGGETRIPGQGERLQEGAIIATGANAFVRLELPDGSHVALPSQSRVRISRLRRVLLTGGYDQQFDVLTGRLEAGARPVDAAGRFEIVTPIAVSAVRGTEFRVAYAAEAGRGATEVLEGQVGVQAADAALLVQAGQGVAASAIGAELASLPSAPTLNDPGRPQSGEAIVLVPEGVEEAVAYRARLATDAGLIDAFAETEAPAGQALTFEAIEDGEYFVRLTAVSSGGLEGVPAVYSILRVRTGAAGLQALSGGSGRDRSHLFRWRAEGDRPAEFRFQLSAAGQDAPPVIDVPGLTAPEITLSGLEPGVYNWRVRVTTRAYGRTLSTWTEPQELRIGS